MPILQEELVRRAELLNEARRLEMDAEIDQQAKEGQFKYIVDPSVPMEERPAVLN